ncbi:hypothetical protein LCGC14_1297870 [marine sediment metagenome]|uniref:Uncharacterized protein n=1 Tax=marine sediment metagenome TaxID=412755 RepID=A0A0F9KS35_9ZZZZ
MADVIFTNNASALLAASINNSELVIQVAGGFGVNFPSPTGAQYFMLTLEDDSGNVEICKCTSRTTDLLTVVRGQDGTVGQAFTLTVTRVEIRLTAAVLEEFVQVTGDSMSGNLNMATNEIQNAELTGTTVITGGQSVGMSIRGTLGQTNNELVVPAASGVRATAGGADIVVDTDDIIALLDTAGVIDLVSATVGVQIGKGAGGYLRIYDATDADYMQFVHDGDDVKVTFVGTAVLSFDGVDIDIANGDLKMNDNTVDRPLLNDFAVTRQAVTATTTTALDYEAGQYVELALAVDISAFSIINPPADTLYGAMRLKITQGAGGQLITWPASVKWANTGTAPVLSTGAGEVDFIDLWTDDAGTTWYGAFATDWA